MAAMRTLPMVSTMRSRVATGRIETGVSNTGDAVDIIGMGAEKLSSTITGVEMFRKILDRGEAGDNVGILLRGIEKSDIKRGMVICKPGSVTPNAKFKAEVYILKKEEDAVANLSTGLRCWLSVDFDSRENDPSGS